ncbi:MAG: hypothetical protein CSA11_00695 [Chloroflexi bacterium]|nr:MAG: hypothetical protein CSB13_07925 [Chloroflexota bacterium]PIE82386.1 MAG: hypothetical protein CSA11_00695 [Chloroflexota bacterium]
MNTKDASNFNNQEMKWVPAAKVQGELVAEVLASQLRAADIPVTVWQESVGNTLGINIGPLGTVRVMVPEEYLEQAQALLDLEPVLKPAREDVVCPYCGVELELDASDLAQGWFTCPECDEETNIVFEE